MEEEFTAPPLHVLVALFYLMKQSSRTPDVKTFFWWSQLARGFAVSLISHALCQESHTGSIFPKALTFHIMRIKAKWRVQGYKAGDANLPPLPVTSAVLREGEEQEGRRELSVPVNADGAEPDLLRPNTNTWRCL